MLPACCASWRMRSRSSGPTRARLRLHDNKAAKRYRSGLRLLRGDAAANARSVTAIMALEVCAGDVLRVEGTGPDAAEAVAALGQLLASGISEHETQILLDLYVFAHAFEILAATERRTDAAGASTDSREDLVVARRRLTDGRRRHHRNGNCAGKRVSQSPTKRLHVRASHHGLVITQRPEGEPAHPWARPLYGIADYPKACKFSTPKGSSCPPSCAD